jgi:dGTP triphosphohydrolase
LIAHHSTIRIYSIFPKEKQIMSNERAFVWAQSEGALIAKPDQDLLATGWVKGSIPAAANFNWLFKTLTEELATLRKDIFTIKDDVSRLREDITKGLHAVNTDVEGVQDQTKEEFSNVRREFAASHEEISGDVDSLKGSTAKEFSAVKKDLTDLGETTTSRINSLTQNMGSEFSAVRTEIEQANEHAENEIAKALEKTAATFSELRLEAAHTKERTNEALRRTVGHNYALIQLGFVGRKICHQLRAMEHDLKKLLPDYPAREWPADENLSAVPREEEDSDGE